jgi:sortase A
VTPRRTAVISSLRGLPLHRLPRPQGRLATRSEGGWLRLLSGACLIAGVALVAWPAVWIVTTARIADDAQTEALAAWDRAAAQPGRQAASVSQGFVLVIPRLGVRRFVPEGATLQHLRRYGIGHISWTALPDATGIVGIAGHRTTYGAPFFRLDRLRAGDEILIEFRGRRYTYSVDGRETVRPDRSNVLRSDAAERGIALVTCSPPYSAAFRLIVFGRLQHIGADESSNPAALRTVPTHAASR